MKINYLFIYLFIISIKLFIIITKLIAIQKR